MHNVIIMVIRIQPEYNMPFLTLSAIISAFQLKSKKKKKHKEEAEVNKYKKRIPLMHPQRMQRNDKPKTNSTDFIYVLQSSLISVWTVCLCSYYGFANVDIHWEWGTKDHLFHRRVLSVCRVHHWEKAVWFVKPYLHGKNGISYIFKIPNNRTNSKVIV